MIEKKEPEEKVFMSLKELMTRKFKDQEWLVERLLPKGAITIISGPAGSYKSYVTLGIALAVAKGQKVMDRFTSKKGKVLIIDLENNANLIQKRMRQLNNDNDLDIYFPNTKLNKIWDFSNDEDSQHDALFCHVQGIDLIIIDSLIRAHSSDENDARSMSRVFKNLKKFTDYGITVLAVHHHRKGIAGMKKNYGESLRGSSDILAAPDSHLSLSREDDEITFYQTKMRYAKELPPFKVKVNIKDNEVSEMPFRIIDENIQASLVIWDG